MERKNCDRALGITHSQRLGAGVAGDLPLFGFSTSFGARLRFGIAIPCSLLAALAMTGCVSPSKLTSTQDVETNRRIVLAFYNEALVSKRVRTSFQRYVSPSFIEHKPDVVGGTREETIVFLGGLIQEFPEARWEVIRSISEGDFVFLHARFTPSPGAAPYSIADIFRLQKGVITEHWDAVGRPPEHQRNPNPRF